MQGARFSTCSAGSTCLTGSVTAAGFRQLVAISPVTAPRPGRSRERSLAMHYSPLATSPCRRFAAHKLHLGTLLVLLFAIWLGCPIARAQCNTVLQSGGPIATLRGRVLTSVRWDPDGTGPLPQWLVVGGSNLTGGDQLSPVGLLAYDGTQWRGLGFDVDQLVFSLIVYQGDLIVAGLFALPTSSGSANNIARRSGNSWLPLSIGVNSTALALGVYAGELIVGGGFFIAGGVGTGPIAKWNGTRWARLSGAGPSLVTNGIVSALATMGNLYVGGSTLGPPEDLLRWDGTNWTSIGTVTNTVSALSVFQGATQASSFLVAAGGFSTIAGVAASHVARANSAGGAWSTMSTGLPQLNSIKLLLRTPFLGTPEVIAAGSIAGSTARVKRWDGVAWNTLGNLGPSTGTAQATAPEYYGGYVVGLYDIAASLRAPSMFRFANDWTPLLGKGIAAPVHCFVADGADIIAGGAFTAIDEVTVNGIARRSGATWSALGSGVSGSSATVRALARAANGEVFAGGNFTTAGGVAASNVARWNGTSWAPLGAGINSTVLALRIANNGELIAGGDFTSAGGVVCNRVARWNGTTWSQMASGMDNSVRCLASLPNGDIVAGGSFLLAGGQTCNHVARWNGSVWNPMSSGMNAAVHALTLRPNGELVAGGAFTAASGVARSRLARWNGSTWLPLSNGVPDTVDALFALPSGDVLAGGIFATGTMNHLARWNALSNLIDGVANGLSGASVLAFAEARNGDVFVGGDFDAILPNQAAGHLAIMTTNCPALATTVPTACVGPSGALTLSADNLPWLGTTFRSTASGFAPQAIAVSAFGLSAANLPLSQLHPAALPNCNLLTSTESLLLVVPVAGMGHFQLAVPNSAVFAGVQLSHQCVQMSLTSSGLPQSISSSNALTLVMGSL